MDETKKRKRMVVEEVTDETSTPESTPKEEITGNPIAPDNKPVEEIKEKVEELQEITEHIGSDVEKSAEVQEQLAEAAAEVEGTKLQSQDDKKIHEKVAFPLSKSTGPSPLLILIPGVLLLGAILGGVYFYQKSFSTPSETSPTPFENLASASPAATSSPSAAVNLKDYNIKVENGSGVAGTASTVKDLLVKAGFEVSTTGNAATYDFTDTVIKTKKSVPKEFLEKLTTTLSGVYKVADTETLTDSSKEDVVVTVGSSKAE